MKKYLPHLLILCLFIVGFTTFIDLAANYHWTGTHQFDDLEIGPTDEDGAIGLPRANEGEEDDGYVEIRNEEGGVKVYGRIDGTMVALPWDDITNSFKFPNIYTLSGTDGLTLGDSGIASIINEYELSGTDGLTLGDSGSSTKTGYSTDKCTGGTATASSGTASDAFNNDGYISAWAHWFAVPPNGWIKYNFGSGVSHIIRRVRIMASDGYCQEVKIEGSNNDSTWTTLVADSNNNMVVNTQWYNIDFANSTAYRYIKITVITITRANGAAIHEIEMMTYDEDI